MINLLREKWYRNKKLTTGKKNFYIFQSFYLIKTKNH